MLACLGCLAAVLTAAEDPVETYDARRVIVDTVFVDNEAGGGEFLPKRPTFRTGAGRVLSDQAFYAYVDRPDLARAYLRKRTRRRALVGVGIGLAAGGTGLVLGSIATSGRTRGALLGSGLGLMAVSMVPIGFGAFPSPHPVSGDVLLDLARDKNKRLRRDLGLPIELSFEPTASRTGGGARVRGRF